jgi:MerR family copper efflux transcriptional regulator
MRSERRDRLVGEPVGHIMTIGELSRRTDVPVKQLRRYEDLGFIYTVGRTSGNYRLFDESALWCVGAVTLWRSLGLTLAEIGELTDLYVERPEENIGPRLAELLGSVRVRTHRRVSELRELLERIDAFETQHRAELSGEADFRSTDPRLGGNCS